MEQVNIVKHKFINFLQSTALLLLLAALIAYLAFVIGGVILAWFAFILVVILFFTTPMITPQFILRMYNASPISTYDAPSLHELVHDIAQQAQLKKTPKLYYIPSRVINAFAVGKADDSAIALSDGVLRKLSIEELTGILAHEITHIRRNDIRVMTFADIAGRMTKILSMTGQLLILINLPLILFTDMQFNWPPLLVMVFAPLISDLIQLSLSRIREYDADLGSAVLLGDARPLASALAKMEHYRHNYLGSLFFPVQKIPEPSILRTHPPVEQRIKRLMALQKKHRMQPTLEHNSAYDEEDFPASHFKQPRTPRRYFHGFWY